MKPVLAAVIAVSLVGGAALAQDALPKKSTEAAILVQVGAAQCLGDRSHSHHAAH